MKSIVYILIVLCSAMGFGQNEFHVFPINDASNAGKSTGDGSFGSPWDLQTALSQSSSVVNGGDVIWIHEGVYNGKYNSTLNATNSKFITVSGYKNDKVILNGNVSGKPNYVLQVNGQNVIYKNFEITFLGDFSRVKGDKGFKASVGINHVNGEDCKFQNLVIHNIPGSGIGSWKATGGTLIEDCIIYNNGYQGKRGHGVGIYIQNKSDKTRVVRNNIIFNNYYKGIEVWSATSGSKFEFVKNVNLTDNIIFNNGVTGGKHVDNIIIASKDNDGINVAKHIKVLDNVLYHNVDFSDQKNYGYGSSLTLGFTGNSPVEDVTVNNNVIIGKNNAFNILFAKSAEIKNNTIYAGYIHLKSAILPALEAHAIKLNNNNYYTRKFNGFRVIKHKDYNLESWKTTFSIDRNSTLSFLRDFKIDPILKVKPLETNSLHYNVALLEKNRNAVSVNFSDFNVEEGMTYKIYDIENRTKLVKSGKISNDMLIEFPMQLTDFEMPLHNTKATKSANNFGVYRVEFEAKKTRKSFFRRLFGWLF